MADVLAGYLSGVQAGRAANASRAKARAEAAEKKANLGLKLATQANVIRGAKEDQMNRLDTMINSDDWTAEQTPRALAFAKSIDDSYGGSDATNYLKTAINLGSKPQTDKDGNKMHGGVSGGIGPVEQVAKPNAGYTGSVQKMEAAAKYRKLGTSEVAGQIKAEALDYLKKNAFKDGQIDPAKVSMALVEFGAELESRPGMDQATVQAVMDNFEDEIGKAMTDQAGLMGELEEHDKYVNGVSKTTTKMIRDIFGAEWGINGNVTKMIDGTDAIVSEMTAVANRKAMTGSNVPEIMLFLTNKYVDAETGKWPTGIKATPWQRAMANATPEYRVAVSKFYQDPNHDQADWVPSYDPKERDGWMVNQVTGELQMLVGPSSPRPDAPPPSPPTKEQLPGEKDGVGSVVGAGAGVGINGIKERAKSKANNGETYAKSVEKVTGSKQPRYKEMDTGVLKTAATGLLGSIGKELSKPAGKKKYPGTKGK